MLNHNFHHFFTTRGGIEPGKWLNPARTHEPLLEPALPAPAPFDHSDLNSLRFDWSLLIAHWKFPHPLGNLANQQCQPPAPQWYCSWQSCQKLKTPKSPSCLRAFVFQSRHAKLRPRRRLPPVASFQGAPS